MTSTPLQFRINTMIQSSLMADLVTMPLHWIYDQSAIAAKVGSGSALFFATPSCPFYSYPAGVFSPYGDESLPLLRSLSQLGHFNRDAVAEEMFNFFSTYPDEGAKGYSGRLNHVTKTFVANRVAGKSWEDCNVEDSQANGIAKVPLIVARYAGHANLVHKIEEMIHVLQKPVISVESSVLVGKLLERILLHDESPAIALHAIREQHGESLTIFQRKVLDFVLNEEPIKEWLKFYTFLESQPIDSNDGFRNMRITGQVLTTLLTSSTPRLDLNEAIAQTPLNENDRALVNERHTNEALHGSTSLLKLGQALAALVVSLLVLKESKALEDALDTNVRIGGDNCSRALVIGAAWGAKGKELPQEWTKQVNENLWKEVVQRADVIAQSHR
eukprot:scaffold2205_cov183-Ochromonas_danica.AAC.24